MARARKIKHPFWLPINVESYRADTADLLTVEHGAFLLLRLHYWRAGPPKDNNTILARITGLSASEWRKVRPALERFFDIDGDWVNSVWDEELETAHSHINKASEAGKKAAKARWDKERNGQGNAYDADTDRMRTASESECDGNANYNIGGKPPIPPGPPRKEDFCLSDEDEVALTRIEAAFPGDHGR